MGKRKEPKFKKGDTVVITMYGTVGNVTDFNFLLLLVMCYDFILTH
ncbi:hypothetical protein [Bacillus sp. CECT 9360]|nr:hypothetical protein [Bacillus sp. CECT 9360]CAH0347345.1 hypothetical protein BCI9360_03741 [Bacillus sp. CECT 9360]